MKLHEIGQLSQNRVTYSADGDKLTATLNGTETDTFDFSGFSDGQADDIETTLSSNPIAWAKKESGVLTVGVYNWLPDDATQEELADHEVTI